MAQAVVLLLLLAVLSCCHGASILIRENDASIVMGDTVLSRTAPQQLSLNGDLLIGNGLSLMSTIQTLQASMSTLQASVATLQSSVTQLTDYLYPPLVVVGPYSGWTVVTGTSLTTDTRVFVQPPENLSEMSVQISGQAGYVYNMTTEMEGGPNRGKAEFWIDGSLVNTFDTYASGVGAVSNWFTFTFPSTGKHMLRVKANGKNASSTQYYVAVISVTIARLS